MVTPAACAYPEVCSKTSKCESWLRNLEGCRVRADRARMTAPPPLIHIGGTWSPAQMAKATAPVAARAAKEAK